MIDLACSAALLALAALVAAGYGVLVATRGAQRFARVERDGGSALLGTGPMSAGYWALQPVGSLLARLGVSPDAVSLASLGLGLAAAAAVALDHLGVASVLVVMATLGDALDGMVARIQGRASMAGEVVDAAVDRYQEFAFLAALALRYRADVGCMTLCLAALLGSVMTSYATAKAEALRVEVPRGAMRRPERALYLGLGATLTPITATLFAGRSLWATHAPMLAALAAVALVANVSAVRRTVATMRALAAPADAAAPPRTVSWAGLLARHQVGSVAATVVDFGVMTLLVERAGLSPVPATAVGALCGAATNFALARRWIFRAHAGPPAGQALRYAMVSAVSLALNTAGERVATQHGGHYLLSRCLVAILVSLCWNFPVQRRFVFRVVSEPSP